MPVPTTLAQASALFSDISVNPFAREPTTYSGLPDIDFSFGSAGGASSTASTKDAVLDALVIGDSQAGGPLGRAIMQRLSSTGYTVSGPQYSNGASGAEVSDMVPDARNMPDLVVAIFGGNDTSTSAATSAATSIYDKVTAAGGYLIIVGPPPATTITDPVKAGKIFKSSIGTNPAPDTWFKFDGGRYAQRRVDVAAALESALSGRENVSVYGIAARKAPPQGPGTGEQYPDQPDGIHVGSAYAGTLAQEIMDGVGISNITKQIRSRATVDPAFQTGGRELGASDLSPGITYSSGVDWSTPAVEFLNRMRGLLDPSVKLHVSSVTRDAKSQASAMLNKWRLGGNREIEKTYGSEVASYFLSAEKSVDSWAAVVSDLRGKGIAFQRGHLTGTAVDIRTYDVGPEGVQALVKAARDAGGKPVLEDNPPHLHVSGLPSGTVASSAPAAGVDIPGRLKITPGVGGSLRRAIEKVAGDFESNGKGYAMNRNSDKNGASYGLIQWTQASGNLHDVLEFLQKRHPDKFEQYFGPNWRKLLEYTEKNESVMYDPLDDGTGKASVLWEDPWYSRFRAAGKDPDLYAAQWEYAEFYDGHMKGAIWSTEKLGIRTERALTLFYDRTVNSGRNANRRIVEKVLAKWAGNPPDYDTALNDYASAALEVVGSKHRPGIRRRNKSILEDPDLLDTELPPITVESS